MSQAFDQNDPGWARFVLTAVALTIVVCGVLYYLVVQPRQEQDQESSEKTPRTAIVVPPPR